MRTRSFEEMLLAYGITELDADDSDNRNEMLSSYQYSVIVEGGFMEFDNLNKWVGANVGSEPINWLVYGKTDYDFGFAEYFFADELQAGAVAKAVPNIHTIYPHSYPPNQTDRSNGLDKFIDYDPTDENAIVVKL